MCLNCTPPKMTKGEIIGTLTKWTFGMDFFKAWLFKIWFEPVLVGHGPKQKMRRLQVQSQLKA
jgi:hypothetical protein